MGKLRQTALILGEGPTEFFYFKSLCDVFKRLTIKPDYPKHTNIKELEAKILDGEAMGGPFVSLTRLDQVNGRVVRAEAFLYAAGQKKRNALRQIEAILYSLKMPNEQTAAGGK